MFTITHYIKGSKNLAGHWIDWEDLPVTSTTASIILHPSMRTMMQFLGFVHSWSGQGIHHGRNFLLFRLPMDIFLKHKEICCGGEIFVLKSEKYIKTPQVF